MNLRLAYSFLLLLSISLPAFAQHGNAPWREGAPSPSSEVPYELKDVAITEHLGRKINTQLMFKNEKGQDVVLGDYFKSGKPVLLSLVYYGCPNLCNFFLNGVTETFKNMDWMLGNQFEMVVISFDPAEDSALASEKKESHIKDLGKPEAAKGWHFLTGDEANIKKLVEEVGFKYHWDEKGKQWAHASAMYVMSPDAVISRYLYGIQFDPKVVRLSLVEASQGKVGGLVDQLILYCFQYDPNKKTYGFYAYNLMRWGSVVLVVIAAIIFVPIWIRERRKSKSEGVA